MKNLRFLAPLAALGPLLSIACPSASAAPEHSPVETQSYEFEFGCGDFDVRISGSSATTFTEWLDDQGEVYKVRMQVSAPADVVTNLDSMKAVTVSAHFVQTYTRVPDTNEFTVTVVGHRYLATEPGEGIIMRDVGRIVFSDPSEEMVSAAAGKHDAATPNLLGPALCGLVD